MPVVKIFLLTRGVHAPRPWGSLTAVQFRYPAELPLNLSKIERFSKVSFTYRKRAVKMSVYVCVGLWLT